TPFLELPGYAFWQSYAQAVHAMLEDDRRTIEGNPTLTEADKMTQLAQLGQTRAAFEAVLDEQAHARLLAEGHRRLSHRATRAALFIPPSRAHPTLPLPFRFLTLLVDVDELLATWRYRHALMVHRMIGTKIGTGGSSGHRYLLATVERNKVFTDLYDLSTFLISRSALPALPPDMERRPGFSFPAAGWSPRKGTTGASWTRTPTGCTSRPTATTTGPTSRARPCSRLGTTRRSTWTGSGTASWARSCPGPSAGWPGSSTCRGPRRSPSPRTRTSSWCACCPASWAEPRCASSPPTPSS